MIDKESFIWDNIFVRERIGFAKLIIIVGSVLLIIASAYLLLNQKSEKTPTNKTALSTLSTQNWIEKKGFFYSFKYPPHWSERKTVADEMFVVGPVNEETTRMEVGNNIYPDLEPEDIMIKKALGEEEMVTAEKEIFVDGHKTIMIEINSVKGAKRIEAYIGDVLSKGTQVIQLKIEDAKNLEEHKEIFNQILSTFKYSNS